MSTVWGCLLMAFGALVAVGRFGCQYVDTHHLRRPINDQLTP